MLALHKRAQSLLKSDHLRFQLAAARVICAVTVSFNHSAAASLVESYALQGHVDLAHHLLDEMPELNATLWNIAISAFFRASNCCAARQLFDRMPCPNDITWSAMIAGYSQNGVARESFLLFKRMRREVSTSLVSSNVFASVLSVCGRTSNLSFGKQVHGFAVKISKYMEINMFVGTSLVDMYGRCGSMELARVAFSSMQSKSVVTWSSHIANYVRNDDPFAAIDVLRDMVVSGTEPNNVTLSTLICACSRIPCLSHGKELHGIVVRKISGKPDLFVSTALVDMYSKCQSMPYAHRVFDMDGSLLGVCPTAMWNAMISGYAVNSRLYDSLRMLRCMVRSTCREAKPNPVTMATGLSICSKLVQLLLGRELHCYATKRGWDKNLIVGNAILDMYCKCGKITFAKVLFDSMTERNRVSWTTLIDGYGMQGDGHGAIRTFGSMVREGNVEPDNITFVALISACSHSGLVEDGLKFFDMMLQEYKCIPREENYGCLVDLVARSGCIDESKNVIRNIPLQPTGNVWGALLGACRIHGDLDAAEQAMQHLHELGEAGIGFKTLLSYIYAETGRKDSYVRLQKEMVEVGLPRSVGFSRLDTEEGSKSCFLR